MLDSHDYQYHSTRIIRRAVEECGFEMVLAGLRGARADYSLVAPGEFHPRATLSMVFGTRRLLDVVVRVVDEPLADGLFLDAVRAEDQADVSRAAALVADKVQAVAPTPLAGPGMR